MNILDLRTVMISYSISNAICVVVMFSLWRQRHRRSAGLGFWLASFILQFFATILIALRGMVPVFVSVIIGNILLLGCMLLLYIGLERYLRKTSSPLFNYIVLVLFSIIHVYFTYVQPNLLARNFNISLGLLVIFSQSAWLALRRVGVEMRPAARMVGVIFSIYSLVSVFRIVADLAVNPGNDLMKSGLFDTLVILTYQMLAVALILALFLMVNRRLVVDLEADILERKRTEQALLKSEEKFTKAFHSSPYAILLTRVSDGTIFEVNAAFLKITGYKYSEVIGKTTLELHLWVREEDRGPVVSQVANGISVQGVELQFRKKSSETLIGLYSAELIVIDNEKFVLSSISDITELSRVRHRLQDEATHDPLTGLPNRTLFYDRFEIARANAQRQHRRLAVMTLDVDEFKKVNDLFGHDIGDQVLVEVGKRLIDSLRVVDTVARFGGDEFVLLIWDIFDKEDAVQVAGKIVERFHRAFIIGGLEIHLTVSIGVAIYPEDGTEINPLIKKSDDCMYYVKGIGKDSYLLYEKMPKP